MMMMMSGEREVLKASRQAAKQTDRLTGRSEPGSEKLIICRTNEIITVFAPFFRKSVDAMRCCCRSSSLDNAGCRSPVLTDSMQCRGSRRSALLGCY